MSVRILTCPRRHLPAHDGTPGSAASKYTTSDVSSSVNPDRSSRFLAPAAGAGGPPSPPEGRCAVGLAGLGTRAHCAGDSLRGGFAARIPGGTTGGRSPAGRPWLGCADAGSDRSHPQGPGKVVTSSPI
jgi:hypothetical protein